MAWLWHLSNQILSLCPPLLRVCQTVLLLLLTILRLPSQGFCAVNPCCLEIRDWSSIRVVWLSSIAPSSQRYSPSLLHSLWFPHHDRHPRFLYYMHICICPCTLFTVCLQHQNWIATKCKIMRCLSDLFSPMTYRLEYSLCHSGQAFFFSDWPLQCVPRLKLYMLQAQNYGHFRFWN